METAKWSRSRESNKVQRTSQRRVVDVPAQLLFSYRRGADLIPVEPRVVLDVSTSLTELSPKFCNGCVFRSRRLCTAAAAFPCPDASGRREHAPEQQRVALGGGYCGVTISHAAFRGDSLTGRRTVGGTISTSSVICFFINHGQRHCGTRSTAHHSIALHRSIRNSTFTPRSINTRFTITSIPVNTERNHVTGGERSLARPRLHCGLISIGNDVGQSYRVVDDALKTFTGGRANGRTFVEPVRRYVRNARRRFFLSRRVSWRKMRRPDGNVFLLD